MLTHMCMSLDGFVAQPDDNPAELFDWYWIGDVVVRRRRRGGWVGFPVRHRALLQCARR